MRRSRPGRYEPARLGKQLSVIQTACTSTENIMRTAVERDTQEHWHMPVWLGVCLLLTIAGFFLWQEHGAHLLGALPYLLLLLCPVIHLLMHRGHGRHASRGVHDRDDTNRRSL